MVTLTPKQTKKKMAHLGYLRKEEEKKQHYNVITCDGLFLQVMHISQYSILKILKTVK